MTAGFLGVGRLNGETAGISNVSAKITDSFAFSHADQDPTTAPLATLVWTDPAGLSDGTGFTLPAGRWRAVATAISDSLSTTGTIWVGIQILWTGGLNPFTEGDTRAVDTTLIHSPLLWSAVSTEDLAAGGTCVVQAYNDAATLTGGLIISLEIESIPS